MEHIGIDVHKVERQLCVQRTADDLRHAHQQPRWNDSQQCLEREGRQGSFIGASTEGERMARCLEQLGREAVVAHPSFAAMYATRSQR
jgi:hypothetical protein